MTLVGKSLPPDSPGTSPAPQVRRVRIDEDHVGQRLDNFLLNNCKGVPKSHVYRVIRAGEVRVNGKRAQAETRLVADDEVRIPPMRLPDRSAAPPTPAAEFPILFEDADLLIIDKPHGIAVHGGSGIDHGVIERLRAARPQQKFLELVHRLDRETSGVLMLAKKRSALVEVHRQLQEGATDKRYLALVRGRVANQRAHLKFALFKSLGPNGERYVQVVDARAEHAQTAHTVVSTLRRFEATALGGAGASLVEAQLKTGRTHQIRVHLTHYGHPILGDERYGDFDLNKAFVKGPLKRMYLHAHRLTIRHPRTEEELVVTAPQPASFDRLMDTL
ncbi:RluA family pseudouridine synthase [soil metagenome]